MRSLGAQHMAFKKLKKKKELGWLIRLCLSFVYLLFFHEQVRAEIQRAKTELTFELQRSPTMEEIIERVQISPERYHDVMKASKPLLSLHSRHMTTQEEFINGVVDEDGVDGDNRRQPALLRLALDDVVTTQPL